MQGDDIAASDFSDAYQGMDCGGYPGPGHAGIYNSVLKLLVLNIIQVYFLLSTHTSKRLGRVDALTSLF